MKTTQDIAERLAPVPGSPLDYVAGVSFAEWEQDDNEISAQVCYQCDMMFHAHLATACAECFDPTCHRCAELHAAIHLANVETHTQEGRE